jgi:hypothetical protein
MTTSADATDEDVPQSLKHKDDRLVKNYRCAYKLYSHLLRFIHSPLVKIIVRRDESQVTFSVHKDIIMKKSGFFRDTIKDFCKGDYTKKIDLSHYGARAFATYLEAVHVSKILPEQFNLTEGSMYLTLCTVYVIAEEMRDPATKNVVIRELHRVLKCQNAERYPFPTSYHIDLIYTRTTSIANPGRQLLVSRWISKTKPDQIEDQLSMLPRQFVHDVVKKLMEKHAKSNPFYDEDIECLMEREDGS